MVTAAFTALKSTNRDMAFSSCEGSMGSRAVALGESLPRVAMLFAGIDHDFAIVLEQINAQ